MKLGFLFVQYYKEGEYQISAGNNDEQPCSANQVQMIERLKEFLRFRDFREMFLVTINLKKSVFIIYCSTINHNKAWWL